MGTIRKRGNRYQARVQRGGQPEQAKTFSTRADAERWARAVERQLDLGGVVLASPCNLSVGELLERYASEVAPTKRGGGMEVIRLRAMQHRPIAQRSVANLTAQCVARYRDTRLQEVSATTVNRDLDDLSAVLNHARREWGLAIPNPVRDVRRPPKGRPRSRLLDLEEEARLMNALDDTPRDIGGRFTQATRNPWIKPLVRLALLTAMRRGELLALEWQHVDLMRRVAVLPMTKNGDARSVPLSSEAVALLGTLASSARPGRVFPTTAMALRKAFERACERANIRDLHFHDLRHTATTRMSALLPNVIELAAVTGHRDLRMLQRYYHPRAEDLARKLG